MIATLGRHELYQHKGAVQRLPRHGTKLAQALAYGDLALITQ